MNETDISLVKKQLARDLKIIVLVQVVALCVFGLDLFLYSGKVIPDYPQWDEVHLLCGVLALAGIIVFVVASLWGLGKLTDVTFLPFRIQTYAGWGLLFFSLLFVFLILASPVHLPIFFCLLLFYCVFPQFFIAFWLAKGAKNGQKESGPDHLE